MNARFSETDFWDFSLDRYARPGISEICLELQDRLEADVNVVLLSLWTGQSSITLSGPDIRTIMSDGAEAWHADAIVPLRTARRNIKLRNAELGDAQIEAFRDKVKVLELEAERHAQRLLVGALSRHCDTKRKAVDPNGLTATCANQNLSNYLEIVAPGQATTWRGQVTALVKACID
jgi:uncharacterized protein (TIGR02444 family)